MAQKNKDLRKKILWLKELGLNVYESPSFKSGKLRARDFSQFVHELLLYLKRYHGIDYWDKEMRNKVYDNPKLFRNQ